jgi:hypothetical protein
VTRSCEVSARVYLRLAVQFSVISNTYRAFENVRGGFIIKHRMRICNVSQHLFYCWLKKAGKWCRERVKSSQPCQRPGCKL